MKIVFDTLTTQNFDEAVKKEWIETNGLGGWASSTITAAHTRRYHGVLVAATAPPLGRMVLLSKLDETIAAGGERYELGCNRYPGAIYPHGFRYLHSFYRDLFPVFYYRVGHILLRKTVAAVNGENTTLVLYEVIHAPERITLELQPLAAARDFHNLTRANEFIRTEPAFAGGIFSVKPYEGVPEIFISVPGSTFQAKPEWYFDFEYLAEKERGLDFREDLFSYGTLKVDRNEGERFGVIISTASPEGRDPFEMFAEEKRRREGLLCAEGIKDTYSRTLTLAADQFIVKRGHDLRTIIAGYHWFSDWGRDAMIALPGICLVTGRFDDGKKILRSFSGNISNGILPNRFPDAGGEPEYNTADASLWFFIAAFKYLHYTNDEPFINDELMPVLRDIITWHDRGTRHNIHVDEDGLLSAGEPGVQVTWMDAKVGNRVITPRQGKAVEINALWYNALTICGKLLHRFGNYPEGDSFIDRAKKVKDRFLELFWNESGGYLYDYIDGEYRDGAVRPNQIFALSLPFPLLSGVKARRTLKTIEDKLYTPFGLRSLSPEDPDYHSHYGGDPESRDTAYHQGTVWGWLMGPYVSAIANVEGTAGKKRARKILENLIPHLRDGGIGTISEIFDGETPHTPRGCVAQAWSVAEILRAYREDIIG
jgi:predicted glycogen debranching enzyme